MVRNPSGLFRTSVKCVCEAFRHNALFRNTTLVIVLLAAITGVPLAQAGEDARNTAVMGTSLVLFLVLQPLEFLLYDLVLMTRPPKGSVGALVFDSRLPAYMWRVVLLFAVFALPQVILSTVFSLSIATSQNPGPMAMLFLGIMLALWIVMLPPLLRVMFFPVVLAAGRPRPVRTSFRATRGKVWRICRAMFLPMLLLGALGGLLSETPLLCARAGMAAYVAACAVSVAGIALLSFVETTFFAIVYRRIVEPPSPGPVLAPAGQPTSFDVQ